MQNRRDKPIWKPKNRVYGVERVGARQAMRLPNLLYVLYVSFFLTCSTYIKKQLDRRTRLSKATWQEELG